MTPSRPSPIAALGVFLRSSALRGAALKRLSEPVLRFLSYGAAVLFTMLILGSVASFFVWAAPPTGRFLQLELNLYENDRRVFYTVEQRLAPADSWSLAVGALKLERFRTTPPYPRRSEASQAHGVSIFGLSAPERSELLAKSSEWLARAKAEEEQGVQELRALLQQSSNAGPLSAEPLLAGVSALARSPERRAIETVREAVLRASPVNPMSISASSRFGASWDASDSPSLHAAFAEGQSLETESAGWTMIGALAWLAPILLSLLFWGIFQGIRAKTKNLSSELLLEWERQNVEQAAGPATVQARSRRL